MSGPTTPERRRGRITMGACLIAVFAAIGVTFLTTGVLASGGGVAESIGLRDTTDSVRARLGVQTDSKYGLRIWDSDGTLLYDLTPGGDGVGFTPRVADTVAGLGTGMKDGEPGYLRLGSSPYESVSVVWDATRSKWVTSTQPIVTLGPDVSTSSTSYANVASLNSARFAIPSMKALYDAGLTPEVFVHAMMHNSGSGTVYARVGINELQSGDAGGTVIATGGEVSVAGTTNLYEFSGWTPMSFSQAPAKPDAVGLIQARVSSGTGTLVGGTVDGRIRWAG
jgi:hypothetical protein